ncbi:hypothetical protein CG428_01235 [Pantoea ananatis]|jgi:hypothetical protein|nr:hypothetical protein CG428_01235 [Pantoea ananatis]
MDNRGIKMKELSSVEVEMVSGAGAIADTGASIGSAIGSIGEQFGLKGSANFGKEIGALWGSIAEKGLQTFTGFLGAGTGANNAGK